MSFQMMTSAPTTMQKPSGHIMKPPASQISPSFSS